MFVYISLDVELFGEIFSILKFVEWVVLVEFGVVWSNKECVEIVNLKD